MTGRQMLLAIAVFGSSACDDGKGPTDAQDSVAAPRYRTGIIVFGQVTTLDGRGVPGASVRTTSVLPNNGDSQIGECRGLLWSTTDTRTDIAGFYRDTIGGGVSEFDACLAIEIQPASIELLPATISVTRARFAPERPGYPLTAVWLDASLAER